MKKETRISIDELMTLRNLLNENRIEEVKGFLIAKSMNCGKFLLVLEWKR